MKKYEVTLVAHYAKTVSIHANSPEQAAEKLKIILFDTDLVKFSEGDIPMRRSRQSGETETVCPAVGNCTFC